MKVNESGFSLIELLIVLAIASIILSATYLSYDNRTDQQTFEYWYQQLELDLLHLQKQTMTTDSIETLTFSVDQARYDIKGNPFAPASITREIPDHWQVELLSLLYPVSFTHNGQLRYSGTMRIITNDATYYIYFPLGKGRSHYAKSE